MGVYFAGYSHARRRSFPRRVPLFLPCSTPKEKKATTSPIRARCKQDNLMFSFSVVLGTISNVADVKPATDENIEGASSLTPFTVFNGAFNSVIFRCG